MPLAATDSGLFPQRESRKAAATSVCWFPPRPAYFRQVERGLKCPTIDTLYKVAVALDVSLTELVRFDSSNAYLSMAPNRQIASLLARVPEDKQRQLLSVMESIVDLL